MVEHSVLVYSRNHGRFIGSCIESLLEQTQPPEEIIVYDAGSNDGSIDILRHFEPRIRLIVRHGEVGVEQPAEAHALQTAFGYSHGHIIFLLEGWDRFKPRKIEEYAAAFDRQPDASLVQAPMEEIDEEGRAVGVLLEPRYHVSNFLREIYRRHDLNLFYPMSALAFSRYYIERVLPFELEDGLPLWTDARLCIPAAYYGSVVTLADPLTERRRRDRNQPSPSVMPIRQTFLRARVFNTFCRRHGLRTISPWRNRRLYLQLLRLLTPPAAFSYVRRRARPLREKV